MADKVFSMIRQTLLHENIVEEIKFQPTTGEAELVLVQSNEESNWPPEYVLRLIFLEVRSLGVGHSMGHVCRGEMLQTIRCNVSDDLYTAEVLVGDSDSSLWSMVVVFESSRYERSPRFP